MTNKYIIAIYSVPAGHVVKLYQNPESAELWRQSIARDNWDVELPSDVDKPSDPKRMADLYFEEMAQPGRHREYFEVFESEVLDAPKDTVGGPEATALATIHHRLTNGEKIDSHTISSLVVECERALPRLKP